MSEDAGIELWHWQQDALTTRLDLIHFHLFSVVYLADTKLDFFVHVPQ